MGCYMDIDDPKLACTWIDPVCTLTADPQEFYLNGTTDFYFSHTPVESGMILSELNF